MPRINPISPCWANSCLGSLGLLLFSGRVAAHINHGVTPKIARFPGEREIFPASDAKGWALSQGVSSVVWKQKHFAAEADEAAKTCSAVYQISTSLWGTLLFFHISHWPLESSDVFCLVETLVSHAAEISDLGAIPPRKLSCGIPHLFVCANPYIHMAPGMYYIYICISTKSQPPAQRPLFSIDYCIWNLCLLEQQT